MVLTTDKTHLLSPQPPLAWYWPANTAAVRQIDARILYVYVGVNKCVILQAVDKRD